jgi:hypothetical protein
MADKQMYQGLGIMAKIEHHGINSNRLTDNNNFDGGFSEKILFKAFCLLLVATGKLLTTPFIYKSRAI